MSKKATKPSKSNWTLNVPEEYQELIKHTKKNELEILNSHDAFCLFCRHHFSAREIKDWAEDDSGSVNAICPECGMDSVVGDASGFSLTHDELRDANMAIYGADFMAHNPQAAVTYCSRYERGSITHNLKNEGLYLQYLYGLSKQGDYRAFLSLGDFYTYGSEFTKPDPSLAFLYLNADRIKDSPAALYRMGILCERNATTKKQYEMAYEYYVQALSFGFKRSIIKICDCYLNGHYVKKNPEFARRCLYSNFPSSYNVFSFSQGYEVDIFPELCYRVGQIFLKEAQDRDSSPFSALRMFLYSKLGYEMIMESGVLKGDEQVEYDDSIAQINKLAKQFDYHEDDPVFDNDTFADSLEIDDKGVLGPNRHFMLELVEYDEESGILRLRFDYDFMPLIMDVASLFVDFVEGPIVWTFTGVESFFMAPTSGEAIVFDVKGDETKGWTFVSYNEEGQSVVLASIVFGKKKKKKKIKKSVGGDA